MNSYERKWIHGPGLVEWIEVFVNYKSLHDNHKRRWRSWKAGSAASLYVVDEILIEHSELSIWDIPEELFVDSRRGRRWPDEVRNGAIKRVEDGEGLCSVARSLGADRKTVRGWIQKGLAA